MIKGIVRQKIMSIELDLLMLEINLGIMISITIILKWSMIISLSSFVHKIKQKSQEKLSKIYHKDKLIMIQK